MNNKADLILRIQRAYVALRELLADHDIVDSREQTIVDPLPVSAVVAHILVHEQRMIEWLAQSLPAGQPVGTQPFDMPEVELAALNAKIQAENEARPLGKLLDELEVAHHQILTLVEAAPEAFLFDPTQASLRGGEALWEAVAANTCDHFAEHEQEIRRGQAQNRHRHPGSG